MTAYNGAGLKMYPNCADGEEQTDEALLKQFDELQKKDPNFGKKQKKKKTVHAHMADELLDDLDEHEKDMNDMYRYLTDMEDLIKGQDLQSIQQMMDVTKDTMSQHFEAYDKFKGQIDTINAQADQAINSLNFYEQQEDVSDTLSMVSSVASTVASKTTKQLDRVLEQRRDSSSSSDGGVAGSGSSDDDNANSRKVKISQEENKGDIVKTLMGMNNQMRDFSRDVESRLDKVKQGKKYGYDNINQVNIYEGTKDDRALNKLHNQAQQYLMEANAM